MNESQYNPQDNSDKFFDMDTSSDEFQDIMQVVLHTVGGPENMNRIVTGCVPGSRTYMSDSHTMTMVMGQAALDMRQFKFALKLVQGYMVTFAHVVDQLSEDERTSIERLFVDSILGVEPSIMAKIEKVFMAEIKKQSTKRLKPDTDQ